MNTDLVVDGVVVFVEDSRRGVCEEALLLGGAFPLEGDSVLGVLGVGDFALYVGDEDGRALGEEVGDYGEGGELEDKGEVVGPGGGEHGGGGLVFEGGGVVVVGGLAAADGGLAVEVEDTLGVGGEVERVGCVELVAEV